MSETCNGDSIRDLLSPMLPPAVATKKRSSSGAAAAKRAPAAADLVRDIERQLARGTRRRASTPMAVAARYQPAKQRLRVELASGAAFEVPVGSIAQLAGATPAQLARVEVDTAGTRLAWPMMRGGVEVSVAELAMHVLGDAAAAKRMD